MQIRFRLDLESDRVRQNFLRGLDYWVQLGLLSPSQINEIAATLSERLPISSAEVTQQSQTRPSARREVADEPTDFVTSESLFAQASTQPASLVTSSEPAPEQASAVSKAIQSLLSEISVIWLLFLGVFLVVISSGVLAASQWQSFSAVGQYAILFAYTLAFWGASLWTGKREQLQTTAKMLSLATALLIPINVWMADALNVFGSIAGIGFGILAAVILSLIGFKLLEKYPNKINLIGLSWLHLGWVAVGVGFWPVVATYIGTIGSAVNLFYQDRRSEAQSTHTEAATSSESPTVSEDLPSEQLSNQNVGVSQFPLDTITIAIAIAILLFRSLFITQIPPHQLGLAAGICGGLIAWLARNKPARSFWDIAGFGLLFLGWAVSYSQSPPWQAISVSAIALWIVGNRLKQTWKSAYLFSFIGIACQAYVLLWFALARTVRETLLTVLSQIPRGPSDSTVWLSIGLFPLVVGILLLARWLRQQQKGSLAKQTEFVALAFGAYLTLLSFPTSLTAAANLTLSTLTLAAVGRKRQSLEIATLTHAMGLMAIAASIDYFTPDIDAQRWTYLALGGGLSELLAHLFIPSDRWKKNLWFGGIGLVTIAYILLVANYSQQPTWLWLPVPIAFSIITNHRRALYPKAAAVLSSAAFLLQSPWIFISWTTAIVNFAIATLFTGLNSRIWRSLLATLFAVAEAIAVTNTVILYSLTRPPNLEPGWLLVLCALEIWALWLVPRLLSRRDSRLSALYQRACWLWSFALLGLFALATSIVAATLTPSNAGTASISFAYPILAAILLAAALIENIHHRPAEWKYWSLGWSVAATIFLVLLQQEVGETGNAIAFLALAFLSQIAGDLWVKKHPDYRASWHSIPLVYAAIGGFIGNLSFTAQSGLYTIAAAALFVNIGRRANRLNPLSYAGLLAFSAGAYECLIYQLSQASGGSPGDGITLLAALALAIALLEKWLSPWLQKYLKLPITAIQNTAHLHWAFGSLLSALALFAGLSQPVGTRLWTAIAIPLAAYALSIGNRRWTPQPNVANHITWTSIGLLQVLLSLAFSRFELFFDRATLLIWAAVIACIASAIIYRLPWDRWGWPIRPFRLLGIWLPLLTVGTTLAQIKIPGLLVVSAFYAWMAKTYNRIRLSYISIFLLDWAILRYLDSQALLTELGFAIIVGLSILYVAQVDPYFQDIQQRLQRHILRIVASVAIALTALYQAEVSNPMLLYAGLTLVLCLCFIFAGLSLKIRAFLYVGTLAFVAQIVRVLWLFISTYSLLLWAVGIVLGLMFIWIAATFESRRSQVTQLLDTWTAALDTWD